MPRLPVDCKRLGFETIDRFFRPRRFIPIVLTVPIHWLWLPLFGLIEQIAP